MIRARIFVTVLGLLASGISGRWFWTYEEMTPEERRKIAPGGGYDVFVRNPVIFLACALAGLGAVVLVWLAP